MSASVDTALCSWCLSTRREDLQLLQPTLQHGPGWVLCSWAQQTPSLAALGSAEKGSWAWGSCDGVQRCCAQEGSLQSSTAPPQQQLCISACPGFATQPDPAHG